MSFVAVAIGTGVTTLASGYMQSKAAGNAADKQADAARYSADIQKQMYDQTRQDQEPWRNAGMAALGGLQDPSFNKTFGAEDMKTLDPGYDFRMQEGQKALERSAAARGGLQSGGTLKALTNYSQDYASNEFNNAFNRFNTNQNNRFNRLASIAGIGQTATGQTAQAGQAYATGAANTAVGAANAGAANSIAQGNIWGSTLSGLSGVGNSWAQYSMMNKMMNPGG